MYLDSQEQAGNMKTVTPSGQDEVAQAGVEQKVSKNSSGRLAVKRSNKKKHLRGNNQHVELPCVFTMQVCLLDCTRTHLYML